MNDERARLIKLIAQAEQEAARWQRAATLLAEQEQSHADEEATARNAVLGAEAQLATLRNEAIAPLVAQALADGRTYINAAEREHEAWKATHAVGRLSKRAAERRRADAGGEARAASSAVYARWGSVPDTGRWGHNTYDSREPWAERVAAEQAEGLTVVVNAKLRALKADQELKQTRWRHRQEAEDLTLAVYGRQDAFYGKVHGSDNADGRAQRWRQRASELRVHLARIVALPVGEAAGVVMSSRAADAQALARRRDAIAPVTAIPSAGGASRDTSGPRGLGD